ncbi:MAG: ATP-binding cassette domain-containing protein [Lentisphaerae bacterium]|nr:ATP-binding cassette domain-containing protein [Lentisphaerota bacterium]
MSDNPILKLDAVTVADPERSVMDLTDISLQLNRGDLLVVVPERHVETVSLYDVVSGLLTPDQGGVLFMGVDWQSMGLFGQSEARGRLHRVFEIEGWVSNLNVFENIALSERHHSARPDDELRQEMRMLLERVGLRDCLADRPHTLSRSERRRAQWVRAFMGAPDLLLLNAPLLDAAPVHHAALFALLAESLARGAAAIWKSQDATNLRDEAGFKAARWSELAGGRMVEQEKREMESGS